MALKEKIKEIIHPKKEHKLVAPRNVKKLKKEGWEEIDISKGNFDKTLLDNLKTNKDLILMEK